MIWTTQVMLAGVATQSSGEALWPSNANPLTNKCCSTESASGDAKYGNSLEASFHTPTESAVWVPVSFGANRSRPSPWSVHLAEQHQI